MRFRAADGGALAFGGGAMIAGACLPPVAIQAVVAVLTQIGEVDVEVSR